jgi:hypothetical protein
MSRTEVTIAVLFLEAIAIIGIVAGTALGLQTGFAQTLPALEKTVQDMTVTIESLNRELAGATGPR